jgi:hypothetical protein
LNGVEPGGLVTRSGRRAVVFTLGTILGALTSALVLAVLLGLSAWVPRPTGVAVGLTVGVGLLAILRDQGVLRLALPENHRQIARDVVSELGNWGFLQFGFELGTGVRTIVSASTPYALVVALVAWGPGLPVFIAAAVGFGVGRAVPYWYRVLEVAWGRNTLACITTVRGDIVLCGVLYVVLAVLLSAMG